MAWKNFFHGVEKMVHLFPWRGKTPLIFSMVWKTFFHSVENPRP